MIRRRWNEKNIVTEVNWRMESTLKDTFSRTKSTIVETILTTESKMIEVFMQWNQEEEKCKKMMLSISKQTICTPKWQK